MRGEHQVIPLVIGFGYGCGNCGHELKPEEMTDAQVVWSLRCHIDDIPLDANYDHQTFSACAKYGDELMQRFILNKLTFEK